MPPGQPSSGMRAQEARADLHDRELVIEMKHITTISQEGENVIVELINEGIKFRCRGVFTKHVLKELTRRANRESSGDENDRSTGSRTRIRACKTQMQTSEFTTREISKRSGSSGETFCRAACHPLYRRAYRLLGNAADAEDAVQDALLAAYTHLDQFKGQSQIVDLADFHRAQLRSTAATPAAAPHPTCLSTSRSEKPRHVQCRSD